MTDASGTPGSAPPRYVTKEELDACIAMLGTQVQEKVSQKAIETERTIMAASTDMKERLDGLPTKSSMFTGWISTAAMILSLLAILQMWFISGWDASESKDGLQDSIETNQRLISEILKIQKRNEERTEKDSRNLRLLIEDHDHKIKFEEDE